MRPFRSGRKIAVFLITGAGGVARTLCDVGGAAAYTHSPIKCSAIRLVWGWVRCSQR